MYNDEDDVLIASDESRTVVADGNDDAVLLGRSAEHHRRNPDSALLMDTDRTILVTSLLRRGSRHQHGHDEKERLVVDSKHNHVVANTKRDSSSADGTSDVPGVVDVMVCIQPSD